MLNYKIYQILRVFILFTLSSCVTENDGSQQFDEFSDASSLQCEPWQTDRMTLGVYDMFGWEYQNEKRFVTKTRRRDNTVRYYERTWKNGSLDLDSTRELFLEDGAKIVNQIRGRNNKSFLVVVNAENRLQLRSYPENKVLSTSVKPIKETYEAKALSDKGDGFWFVSRSEDNKNNIDYFKYSNQKNSQLKQIYSKSINTGTADNFFIEVGKKLAIFSMKTSPSKSWIEYSILNSNGALSPQVDLNLPVKNKGEKWDVMNLGNRTYVAVLDGDSYLRQSMLRVASLELRNSVFRTNWMKSKSLMNFHVSDPAFVNIDGKINLLVPKWLDDRSTLARYVLSDEDASALGHIGQFQKAAKIFVPEGEDTFFIVRTKSQVGWQFEVCTVEK